ncbi:MAG: SGNH/GDSL hydrolase family protein [Clostridia bacterium]|nr:SGNH/GDSL hydrolase family protein [Clostridia bacterium]
MKVKTALRNAVIILISAAAVIAAVEFSLHSWKITDINDEIAAAAEENDVLFAMGMERASVHDLFSTRLMQRLFSLDLESMRHLLGVTEQDLDYHDYPLIDNMPRDDIYDADTVEIVVIGDSFVWGYSCTDRNEVFWRLLENSLRRQGYNVRVDAVATPGANAYEELRWVSDSNLVKDLDPDMIIFGYLCNDPEIDEGDRFNLISGGLKSDVSVVDVSGSIPCYSLLKKVLPNITERLENYLTAKKLYNTEGEYLLTDTLSPVLKGENREYYVENFAKPLERFAAQTGVRTVVMNLPPYPDNILQKALYAPLHEIFAECEHVTFYDCLETFCKKFASAKHNDNYSINAADRHPGSATNYFYSTFAEEFLLRDYAPMLGGKAEEDKRPDALLINDWLPYGLTPTLVSQTGDTAEYTIEYPSKTRSDAGDYRAYGVEIARYFLKLPLGEEYVRVSFAQPVDLKSVEISGSADDIELYYARVNTKLGYDDHKLQSFGARETLSPGAFTWTDGAEDLVTGLCIRADYPDGDGGTLRLKITRAGE